MANLAKRLPHNAEGDFYVDASCIDCDTCRWMAPAVFARREEQASVGRQPRTEEETRRALQALVSCPTASIGTVERHDLAPIVASFPEEIAPGVLHTGFHSPESFGAAAYLVVRPGGNVLVDSPRFASRLVRRIEELGGVATMFLTHQDDVAEHRRFRERFGCERVIHAADVGPDTAEVERRIEGTEPVALADDLLAVPTPGHTEGSMCLLAGGTYLFTGDHLAWSERLGQVYAFRDAAWFDWETQIASMRRLAELRFEWVLPGHGRRCRFPPEEMRGRVLACVAWMERER